MTDDANEQDRCDCCDRCMEFAVVEHVCGESAEYELHTAMFSDKRLVELSPPFVAADDPMVLSHIALQLAAAVAAGPRWKFDSLPDECVCPFEYLDTDPDLADAIDEISE